MLVAFGMLDNYSTVAAFCQEDGTVVYEEMGYLGERFEPGGLAGLDDVLRETFPNAPQIEDPEVAAGARSDEALSVADLEMLGGGDPGDRILPENLVSTGDPVQDEGLTEDVLDLRDDGQFPSIDGEVYIVYFIDTERNSQNPYGSRNRFAGTRPTFKCPNRGRCELCWRSSVPIWTQDNTVQYDTPCHQAWERHPVSWEGSRIQTLPAFFQVVAALPRRKRNAWKNIRTRYGEIVSVQMKDAPNVVVRWGNLDEDGRFVPGILDERTGERSERYSVLPAWALYNVRTGEQFKYQDPTARARLNRPFRERVLRELRTRWPQYWRRVIQPKPAGIRWWRVDCLEPGSYLVRLALADRRILKYFIELDNSHPVGADTSTTFGTFALQAAMWRQIEHELTQEGVPA